MAQMNWRDEALNRLEPGSLIGRHRHRRAYAAVVLEGSYLEAGDAGRWIVEPGDVLVHGPMEAHLNRVGRRGARLLNIDLPLGLAMPQACRVRDADELMRCLDSAPGEAWKLLEPVMPPAGALADWPDLLARAIREVPHLRIGQWARAAGLAPAVVSRGFCAVYGVPPARYRAEARARAALKAILYRGSTLADAAIDMGFADQAHMTRSVRALTGQTPAAWRRVNSVQDDASSDA